MNQDKKMQLRMPEDIHQFIVQWSAKNDRSINGQIISILREKMQEQVMKPGCPAIK